LSIIFVSIQPADLKDRHFKVAEDEKAVEVVRDLYKSAEKLKPTPSTAAVASGGLEKVVLPPPAHISPRVSQDSDPFADPVQRRTMLRWSSPALSPLRPLSLASDSQEQESSEQEHWQYLNHSSTLSFSPNFDVGVARSASELSVRSGNRPDEKDLHGFF
jgi:hypothetical protein